MPTVKETSDSLSHPVVETPHIVVPARRRTVADYVALGVATCGVGLIPLAPGTWGAGLGVCIYLGLVRAVEQLPRGARTEVELQLLLSALLFVAIFAAFLGGTWAATRTERLLGRKDPGVVVVDEVAGQLVTLLSVPRGAGVWTLFAAFLAFRLFDIWKPYPIDRLEGLPKGLGIMADDMLAGFYGAALISLLVAIQTFV